MSNYKDVLEEKNDDYNEYHPRSFGIVKLYEEECDQNQTLKNGINALLKHVMLCDDYVSSYEGEAKYFDDNEKLLIKNMLNELKL